MNWFKSFWSKLKKLPAQVSYEPKDSYWSRVWREMHADHSAETLQGCENLTPRAIQVLALAREEAARFNHNFVGTEHLLLGLIKLGQGVGFDVLIKLGLELETVRAEVEKQVGKGPAQKMPGTIPYTPRVKKVIRLAKEEAKSFNHTYMGTEHILLGLLREGDGVAARVFKNFNVSLDQTRQTVSKELDSNSSPTGGKHSTKNRLKLLLNSTKVRKLDIQESSPESLSNFTPRAQQVLALARKEADRFNHNFAGTEHLLLGLIKLGQGVAVNVLAKLGLDLETVCKEIEKQVGTGPDQKLIGNIPYTPRVKKVLALAAKEAKALNHTYVGTEHILLGLLREGDGVAARVLKNLHVDIKQTRNEILKELDPNFDQNQDNKLQEPPSEHMLNFSPHAQQLLGLAHKEADRFNHNFVGTEHVLLGMIKLGQGVGFKVLLRLGLDVETIRLEIEKEIGTGTEQKTIGNIPYTPQLKKVLSLAVKEARALSHTYVGTEHILLGLIREGDSFTAKMLNNLDITFEETRQEILKELDIRLAQAPDVQPQSDASKLAAQPIPATSPAPTFSLEHIGLPALDPTALKDWYISVLDAKLVFENGQTPPAYFLKLPGGVMLEIYQAEASPAETANNGLAGWRHLALRVEAIEPARDALEKKGVQFPDPIKPAGGGGRVLFFRDPAQNLLHLVERPSGSLFR